MLLILLCACCGSQTNAKVVSNGSEVKSKVTNANFDMKSIESNSVVLIENPNVETFFEERNPNSILFDKSNDTCSLKIVQNPTRMAFTNWSKFVEYLKSDDFENFKTPDSPSEIPDFVCDGECEEFVPYSVVLEQEFSAEFTALVAVFEGDSKITVFPSLVNAIQIWRCGPEIDESISSGEDWKRISFRKIQSNLYWDYESKTECDEFGNLNCGCFASSVETVDFLVLVSGQTLFSTTIHKKFDEMGEVLPQNKIRFQKNGNIIKVTGCDFDTELVLKD